MKFRCLIVDDEPLAQEVLVKFIALVPSLSLVQKCDNALEALQVLHSEKIDVLFTDIKMPELSGLQLARSLSSAPKIILTTAFSEYALEGFDLGVTDYLMKPFSFERFLLAVNRAVGGKDPRDTAAPPPAPAAEPEFLFFKVDRRVVKVALADVLYLQGYGNYVKIHLRGARTLVATDKMTNVEKLLTGATFMRVHKSYIVALAHISEYDHASLAVEGVTLPIGDVYRKGFMETMKAQANG
ncbi:response regulator transcription factor [Hymenobacter busanensis]|uniref:Response regulator transcription factor n=1 Tax=Hymenobacter busanensis TaxID=2607656 RepID=A0A7L4ZSG4_9BACT|nr:LytTR family DNA-binding domain-containing protein [Hymenobacter busanensis]KAA9327171.1 response regulator transcription factor [Hymenobacter busanensis]QHJ05837.1 response regulator [Hymenobacter busanensis]